MAHVHKPEHGSCGACPGAKGCPMVYCPTCPTPVLCEQTEALTPLGEHHGLTQEQVRAGVERMGTFGLPEKPTAPLPSLGRIVHVLVHPTLNNGSDVAPAVVTRVHGAAHDGSRLVNLRVFLDGTNRSHEWATGQHLFATEAEARREWAERTERLDGFEAEHRVGVSGFAFWPPRG